MKHVVRNLKIWNESIELATEIYRVSSNFPTEEKFGLTSQIRRASVSIASNIAEGAGRNTNRDFAHFLGIANGSSYEVMTQLILAQKLGMITGEQSLILLNKLDEIQKMTNSFQKYLLSKAA